MLGQDRLEKNSPKCLNRCGEIPSPRQTSTDKIHDCVMNSERSALVRGSDLRSGHSVHNTPGDTVGIACTRGSPLILPILASFGPSVLLIIPVLQVFRPPVLQYSQYSEHEMYSILRVYSEYEVYREHLCNTALSLRPFLCGSYMHAASGMSSWSMELLAFATRQFSVCI